MLEYIPRGNWDSNDWEDAIRGRQDGYDDGRADGYVSDWNIFEDFDLDEMLFYWNSYDDRDDSESDAYVVAYNYGYDEGFQDGFFYGNSLILWD